MSYRISDKYPERRSQRLRTSDRNIFSVRCEVLQRWRIPRDDNIDCCHRGNSIAIDLSLAHDERRDELVSSHSDLGVLMYGTRQARACANAHRNLGDRHPRFERSGLACRCTFLSRRVWAPISPDGRAFHRSAAAMSAAAETAGLTDARQ